MTPSKERPAAAGAPDARGSTVSAISSVWEGSSRSRHSATTCSSWTPSLVGSSSKAMRVSRKTPSSPAWANTAERPSALGRASLPLVARLSPRTSKMSAKSVPNVRRTVRVTAAAL